MPEDDFVFIEGVLISCSGLPSDGYLTTNYTGFFESVTVAGDGSFSLAIPCSQGPFEIVGYSLDYQTSSGAISITPQSNPVIDVGLVEVCAVSAEEYLVLSINGDPEIILTSDIYVEPTETILGFFYFHIGDYIENDEYLIMRFWVWDDEEFFGMGWPFANPALLYIEGSDESSWETVQSDYPLNFEYTVFSNVPGDYVQFIFDGEMTSNVGGPDITVSGYGRIQHQ
jgi:hypothetical protein